VFAVMDSWGALGHGNRNRFIAVLRRRSGGHGVFLGIGSDDWNVLHDGAGHGRGIRVGSIVARLVRTMQRGAGAVLFRG
jgi:hypothetical protein